MLYHFKLNELGGFDFDLHFPRVMIYHLVDSPRGGDLCELLPVSATCFTPPRGSISYAFTLSYVCLIPFQNSLFFVVYDDKAKTI